MTEGDYMKKVGLLVTFVISICLLTGCGGSNNIRELSNNLASEIEMDTTGAVAVCTINSMDPSRRSSIGGKVAIFGSNGIVTRTEVTELFESNDIQTLQAMQVSMIERHEILKTYGGQEQETSLTNRRLTLRGTVHHEQVEWERLSHDDLSIREFLNDDFRFTVESMIKFLELNNFYRCETQ